MVTHSDASRSIREGVSERYPFIPPFELLVVLSIESQSFTPLIGLLTQVISISRIA